MPDWRLMLTDGVVVLRQWRLTDADWYAEAVRDPEIQRFTREPPELTAAKVEDAIVALADQPEVVGFCICDAATGQRLGNIALRHDAAGGSVAYWVAAPARGRGVATRALRLVSDWAAAALALPVLRLWTHADNVASRRVAEHAGYQRAPGDDQRRAVKGQVWETVGYRRAAPRPGRPSSTGRALIPPLQGLALVVCQRDLRRRSSSAARGLWLLVYAPSLLLPMPIFDSGH